MSQLNAGLDVSLALTSICVLNADGCVVHKCKVASDPEAIASTLRQCDGSFERIGFEAGPLSHWLYFGLVEAGLPAVCIEARHAKAALVAMNRNKNDRNDARSLSHLIRSGWFSPCM